MTSSAWLLAGVSPRHPVGGACRAIAFAVRNAGCDLKGAAGRQVQGIVATGQPHFALRDHGVRCERVGMQAEHGVGGPVPLQRFVETGRQRV